MIPRIVFHKLGGQRPHPITTAVMLGALTIFAATYAAAGADEVTIRFADHHFTPQTLNVPAGQPIVIKVINASKETIEFESFKLNREVAMTPGETTTVRLPALSAGSYDFYDDFHQDVPQGSIVAK
jgi:heme/copper-type cytochrome/quinol oxidase subunit 2